MCYNGITEVRVRNIYRCRHNFCDGCLFKLAFYGFIHCPLCKSKIENANDRPGTLVRNSGDTECTPRRPEQKMFSLLSKIVENAVECNGAEKSERQKTFELNIQEILSSLNTQKLNPIDILDALFAQF